MSLYISSFEGQNYRNGIMINSCLGLEEVRQREVGVATKSIMRVSGGDEVSFPGGDTIL